MENSVSVDEMPAFVGSFASSLSFEQDYDFNKLEHDSEQDVLLPENICSNSNCQNNATSKCKKCESANYCSRECQLLDWNNHRQKCNIVHIIENNIENNIQNIIDNNIENNISTRSLPKLSKSFKFNVYKLTLTAALKKWHDWKYANLAFESLPIAEIKSYNQVLTNAIISSGLSLEDPDVKSLFMSDDKIAIFISSCRFVRMICSHGNCQIKDSRKLRACTYCALVFYCSKDHQEKDYATHRKFCLGHKYDAPVITGKLEMIIGRVNLKK